MKNDTGGGCDAKKFLQPIFLGTQFSLPLISLIGSNNITVNNNKNIQKVICVSEIAILSHPNHHNSTILQK